MRPFKFRVWNKKTKLWIHGPNENNSLDGVNLFGETIILGAFLDGISIEDLNDVVAVQYTGFKDRNGKDVFEGDVLLINGTYEDAMQGDGNSVVSVIFKDGCFYVCDPIKNSRHELLCEFLFYGGNEGKLDLKVIGNIFENSDLL